MRKNHHLFLLLLVAACSSQETPYANYPELREKASARCAELGHLVDSPEFYSCVGTQYTRLKQEELY